MMDPSVPGDPRSPAPLTLERFVEYVLAHAEPMSQNTSEHNLGFGWLYYAFIRNVRPAYVVAIGSRRGFMPFCAARAVQDNGSGKVLFLDPSYAGPGHPGWGGEGLWSDPVAVDTRIASHGLAHWIEHIKLESGKAFPHVRDRVGPPAPGIVIVDGAHTYEQSLQDFELYSSLFSEGFVLFHDATSPLAGLPQTLAELVKRGVPVVTVHREVGLAIAEIRPRKSVDEAWSYLSRTSNRAEQVAEIARPLLRDRDLVMDAYCGVSPLAGLMTGVKLFGFDRDADCIRQLGLDHPEHTWHVIEERELPFSRDLPDEVHVLLGLGLTSGQDWWEPQEAVNNFRYLIGRYAPRACILEAAADYHSADVLRDLKACLVRAGYDCHYEWIHTDMDAYPRRKILVAQRDIVTPA